MSEFWLTEALAMAWLVTFWLYVQESDKHRKELAEWKAVAIAAKGLLHDAVTALLRQDDMLKQYEIQAQLPKVEVRREKADA